MIIGGGAGSNPEQQGGADQLIFDADVNNFEGDVLRASMEKPILVDFWAPWCGPCKQLMPILEKVVQAAGGKIKLAKVNLDENPELAQALRVQSVPTVFAFFKGQPVHAFQGVQPESQIQAFIDELVKMADANAPEALNIPESLKAAEEALKEGRVDVAQAIYGDILEQDEDNVAAYIGMIRSFITDGTPEHAREMLEHAPEAIAKAQAFIEAKPALELAAKDQGDESELAPFLAAVEAKPDDQDARLVLAEAQFGAGQKEQALETLLGSIAQDREWNEQAARKQLLEFFKALGNADPLTVAYRKKLSTLLFS